MYIGKNLYIKKQMKIFIIIYLCMLSFSLSVQEYDCEETKAPNPSGAKDCNARKVDSNKLCCYIKGKMRKGYYIQEVDGCYEVDKKEIENNSKVYGTGFFVKLNDNKYGLLTNNHIINNIKIGNTIHFYYLSEYKKIEII